MTRANRAPLLFGVPGGEGQVIANSYAEFVDIMPTVSELALGREAGGLPPCATPAMSRAASNCTEGASLAGVVRARAPRGQRQRAAAVPPKAKQAAFGQWPMRIAGEHRMGYNIYTMHAGSSVRYTEWVGYSKAGETHGPVWPAPGEPVINELYNHTADPDENVNVANDTALAPVVAALSAQLRAGWRALPTTRYGGD